MKKLAVIPACAGMTIIIAVSCGGSAVPSAPQLDSPPTIQSVAIDAPIKSGSSIETVATGTVATGTVGIATMTQPQLDTPQVERRSIMDGSLPVARDQSPSGSPTVSDADKSASRKYRHVSFQELTAFNYEEGMMIPDAVMALNKSRARLQGYMLPLEIDEKQAGVITFLLMADQQGCCYGMMPEVNGWVVVKMKPGNIAPYLADVPLVVEGDLSVEERYRQGALLGIYHLDADRAGPLFS